MAAIFLQLPEPLIPYEHYNAMIVAGSPNKGTVNLEELSRVRHPVWR